jgi:hypothetical protein
MDVSTAARKMESHSMMFVITSPVVAGVGSLFSCSIEKQIPFDKLRAGSRAQTQGARNDNS